MSLKRKVVLLVDNSIDFTGAFKCALQQAQIMQQEYRYVFVLPRHSKNIPIAEKEGFTVYTLPMIELRKDLKALVSYLPLLMLNSYRLNKIIRKEKASTVVMNDFYNLLGVLVKKNNAAFRLVTFVRLLPSATPKILRSLWVNSALKKADTIVAVSDAVKNELPADLKITRIYDPAILREKYPYDFTIKAYNKIRLLYLANYIRGKGHDFAVEAFAKALSAYPEMELYFSGGDMGLEKNKRFRAELQARCIELNIQTKVHFLPFTNDVEELIKQADIVLNFSEAESFSMTVLESVYYGTPVIASRCGGPEEIIIEGETGLTVANRNIGQMTEAILYLAQSPGLRKQFSEKGRAYVRQKFSLETFKEKLNCLFEDH